MLDIEEIKNKIICGDCLEKLKLFPNKSIDMILCDLPYGISACKWDSIVPLDALWVQYFRLIKDHCAIVLTASQPFTSSLVMSNIKGFKYEWIWDKHIPRNFLNAKIMPMQRHESVLVFGNGKIKYNPQMVLRDKPAKVKNYSKKGKDSVYLLNQGGSDNETRIYPYKNPDTIITGCWEANAAKIHPTQKPVSLFEYLIKTYTNEGDIVLDNCLGSGTTGVACKKLNRNFIGIEINPEYCKLARERIDSIKI